MAGFRLRARAVVLGLAYILAATAMSRAAVELRPTVVPLHRGGTVLVWARDFERSDLARVSYDSRTQSLSFVRGNTRLVIQPGSRTARLNGLAVPIPAPACIIGGRAMVPGRLVLDALGLRNVDIAGPKMLGPAVGGAISGRVRYAGRPQPNITLRLARAGDFVFVLELCARTDAEGRYSFTGVPDGAYRVYAYVGDNPNYFNRVTTRLEVAGGSVRAPDINMGRVLQPGDPPQGAILSPARDMVFTWSSCPRAAQYHLSVVDPASSEEVFSATGPVPCALIDVSRMKAGRDYVWRVTATDVAGAFLGGSPGSGTEPWTFSLAIE